MNILLITTLYPAYNEHSRQEISYALHYFARDWVNSGNKVNVIRVWPKYPKLFSVFKKGEKANRYGVEQEFDIDGVHVSRKVINKYPKIDYLQGDIYNVYNNIINNLEDNYLPDVIICHMVNPSLFIASHLKEELDVPIILVMHNSDILQLQNVSGRLNKFKYFEKHISKIGFRSRELYNKFKRLPNMNNKLLEESFIITSGINVNDVISFDKLYQKINSPPPKIIFIAASMLPLKNIDVVIRAFGIVFEKYNVILRIAGDGPEKEKLHNLAQKSKAKKRIEFLGFIQRETVMEIMEKSHIFVMVSSPETFGLVYIEAMGKGCITIGTKDEGIDGVIQNEENGFLCRAQNVQDLASIFIKILNLSFEVGS